ncbi:DUF3054 domain-containing protein [Streptomyces sp. AC495_CC817]|uniref:DUF3054 domain-containing protein n=1 Tax=Streptomyces sp. AC495_CC817 TaxID=2823900 RepID=UPI001C255F60|nr:DUF3054 domain-containing protein [Streptomyces sp. AC495_CC817]
MRYLPALVLDAVLVLVFAAIGRASHEESAAGFLLTGWPFLVALVVGHAVAALLPARPRRPWSVLWGAVVWVVTVIGGMILRVVSGDTAQVPFIIVATIVLGVFLVGWRALAALLRRRRSGARPGDQQDAPVSAGAPATKGLGGSAHDGEAAATHGSAEDARADAELPDVPVHPADACDPDAPDPDAPDADVAESDVTEADSTDASAPVDEAPGSDDSADTAR